MRNHSRVGDRSEDGFTLIELLVVIIIIGILAAIAIPLFLRQKDRALQAAMRSDLRDAASLMETYYLDNGFYPTAIQYLPTQPATSKGTVLEVEAGSAPGTYCLKATHPSSSLSFVVYDSDRGGMLPADVPCS